MRQFPKLPPSRGPRRPLKNSVFLRGRVEIVKKFLYWGDPLVRLLSLAFSYYRSEEANVLGLLLLPAWCSAHHPPGALLLLASRASAVHGVPSALPPHLPQAAVPLQGPCLPPPGMLPLLRLGALTCSIPTVTFPAFLGTSQVTQPLELDKAVGLLAPLFDLGEVMSPLCLCSIICKMGMIMPTSWGDEEDKGGCVGQAPRPWSSTGWMP